MTDYFVPRLYVAGHVKAFEQKAAALGLRKTVYHPGETLTTPGVINNTAHYICSGVVLLSLIHSSGSMKSIMFFGPKTVFPLGVAPHENLIDYEMVLKAITDVTVYSFSYPVLRQLCVEDGEFAAQLLEENCKMIGYLFYQEMNQTFMPTEIRVCDVLYLFVTSMEPDRTTIPMRQDELASLVGISCPQLERILKDLRGKGVIQTARGKITIPDLARLRALCSTELMENEYAP